MDLKPQLVDATVLNPNNRCVGNMRRQHVKTLRHLNRQPPWQYVLLNLCVTPETPSLTITESENKPCVSAYYKVLPSYAGPFTMRGPIYSPKVFQK